MIVTTLALPSGVGPDWGNSRGVLAREVLISSTASKVGRPLSSTSVNSASIISSAEPASGSSSTPQSTDIRAPSALGRLFNMTTLKDNTDAFSELNPRRRIS